MKPTIYLSVFIVLLFSCKKDKNKIPDLIPKSSLKNYSNMAVGNYWVYSINKVDSSGVETPTDYMDSTFIEKVLCISRYLG